MSIKNQNGKYVITYFIRNEDYNKMQWRDKVNT